MPERRYLAIGTMVLGTLGTGARAAWPGLGVLLAGARRAPCLYQLQIHCHRYLFVSGQSSRKEKKKTKLRGKKNHDTPHTPEKPSSHRERSFNPVNPKEERSRKRARESNLFSKRCLETLGVLCLFCNNDPLSLSHFTFANMPGKRPMGGEGVKNKNKHWKAICKLFHPSEPFNLWFL